MIFLIRWIVKVMCCIKEKVLRLLTWSGYAPDELIKAFEEETGYIVEVTYTSNEEMISKLRATRGGGYDLAEPSFDRVPAVTSQYGIYQPIDYSRVDLDQIEPNMLAAVKATTMVDGESYGVPHVSGTNGMIVNKALAPDVTPDKAKLIVIGSILKLFCKYTKLTVYYSSPIIRILH